ncbi:MAG: hypothetical protein A2041_13850 [Bacteroidetes bacterium GWA2_31_9b]|nr:MAG: hypothetical protein A2041_13850 [Bacteroidetes bacterium GWA2_31_9b]
MALEIKKTSDGSTTIYNSDLNENYHSSFGAVSESMHVFIKNGLQHINKLQINILEIGFGTGLNAILTYKATRDSNTKVNYTALEFYPLDLKLISNLNFVDFIQPSQNEIFTKMHECEWNKEVLIHSDFTLHKIMTNFNQFQFKSFYDLVYFDAFAPDIQPEMWSETNFKKIYNSLNPSGILVTYSAKGLVKQNLRSAGFTVTRLVGAPGKRHMLRAEKI